MKKISSGIGVTALLSIASSVLTIASAKAQDSTPVVDPTGPKYTEPTYPSSDPSDQLYNIRINPLGLLLGEIGADIDFGISESVTLGPSVSYLKASATDDSGNSVTATAAAFGLRANFYLSNKRFHDGWYLAPSAYYIPLTVSDTISGSSYSATLHMLEVEALCGYQWVWKNGFNMTLGAGVGYYSASSSVTITNSSGGTSAATIPIFAGVVPAAEFGLGWVF